MDPEVKKALSDIVGGDNVTDALIDLVSYSYDASPEHHRPDGAVWAKETNEVSVILEFANRHRIPIIPRGAGTGLTGMAVPVQGGVVLDMTRMNKILKISIEDRLVVVQPGVVYQDLQQALAPHGFLFPPDPASGKVCTLGGNVSTNAGGLKGAKYGTTRDYVLGLEVVLADGSVLRSGSECMKSVSGYDLTGLFVGSEGTLGVITEIVLKISPSPRSSTTCVGSFDHIEEAGKAISEIMISGILPSVLELLDDQCIAIVNQTEALDLPAAAAVVLAAADGYTQAETDHVIDRIIEVLRKNKAKGIRRAVSAEEADKLWAARRLFGGAVASLRNNVLAEDITVPISKVPDVLTAAKAISRRHNLCMPILGHLGDGNLHPCIVFDHTNPEETARVNEAAGDLLKLGIELGGTLSGEHGIGIGKALFMSAEHGTVAMKVMSGIKRTLDPNNILNPGKMGLAV